MGQTPASAHDLIRTCKQAVMVPMQLVSYGFVALLPGGLKPLLMSFQLSVG